MHTYLMILVIQLAEYPSSLVTMFQIYFDERLQSISDRFFVRSCFRDYLSGMPMQISLLKRRLAARSSSWGRLVAPITSIYPPFGELMPSSNTRNYVFSLLDASFSFYERLVSIESISSINIMVGLSLQAASNIFLNIFSVYPTSLFMTDAADKAMNVQPDQFASALQMNVFPLPGGPYKSNPLGGALIPLQRSGRFLGLMTAYYSIFLVSAIPMMSSKVVLEFTIKFLISGQIYFNISFFAKVLYYLFGLREFLVGFTL